jgi:hypothetical protein
MKRYLVALALLAACDQRDKQPMDQAAAAKLFEQIEIAAPPGMSDLSIDDRGVLWSIAERERKILEIDISKRPAFAFVHELQGIAKGVDTEGLVWLGGGTFAIGVEGAHSPSASVVSAERRGDAIVATATRELSDAQLGVTLTANHGFEAVCGRAGELLAACESIGTDDGKRWAPVVRLRGNEPPQLTKLWLTSKEGKISALTCTIGDDGVAHVAAIERHFGVARILSFDVARDATEVTPKVEIDLHPIIHDDFNLEGITRLADGRFVLINDNQAGKASGPTQLFVFHSR